MENQQQLPGRGVPLGEDEGDPVASGDKTLGFHMV